MIVSTIVLSLFSSVGELNLFSIIKKTDHERWRKNSVMNHHSSILKETDHEIIYVL